MTNVSLIDPAAATGTVADQPGQIQSAFGVVPNVFRAVANSPAALSLDVGFVSARRGDRGRRRPRTAGRLPRRTPDPRGLTNGWGGFGARPVVSS